MSQIKKLQAGGNFTIDSRTWNASDADFLRALEEHINNAPHQYLPYLGTVISDLKSGRDVTGNRAANTQTFSKPGAISDKEWERAHTPRSTRRKHWDSIVGSEYDLLDGAIAYLNSFDYQPNDTASASNKRKIASDKGVFDYNPNPDGTKTYSKSNPNNASYIQRANDWYDYLSGVPAGEGYDDWDLSGYKNVDAVKAWFKGLENPRQFWDDVIKRTIEGNGTFSPEDEDFWNWMNIGLKSDADGDSNGNGDGDGSSDNANKDKILNPDQVAKGGPKLIIGDNGRPIIVDNWKTDTKTRPYIITEDDDDYFGPNYRNWVIYNNELYNQDEILSQPQSPLGEIMNSVLAIQKNRETLPKDKWNAMNQIVQWRGSDGKYPFLDYNIELAYLPDFYDYFAGDNFKYDWYDPDSRQTQKRPDNFQLGDVTELYDGLAAGNRIYRYFNHGDPFNQSTWGFRQPHFAVFTPNGIQSYDSENALLEALGITRNNIGNYRTIIAYDWLEIPGKGKFGKYASIKDTDGNDWIIYWQNGKFYTIGAKDKVKQLSNDLVDKIFRQSGVVNRRELDNGYTDEEATKRQSQGWSYGTYKKNGGKINHLRKLQTGGNISGSSDSPYADSVAERTPGQRPGKWGETMTDADVMQAIGIAGDVLGAIASLVPGYGSIAGATLGLGSTGAYLASDIKRDGLDWGDVGSAGINLVFDAATLLPVIGEGAKAAKIAKRVSSVAHILTPIMSGLGMTAAVNAINKMSNGEKPTIDDMQALAAGLQGLVGMGHMARQSVGEARLSKEIKNINAGKAPEYATRLSNKDGNLVDIKLKDGDVKTILDSKNPEEALKNILKSDAYKDLNISEEALNSKGLLDKFGFGVKRGKLFKRNTVKGVEGQKPAEKTTLWSELHPFRPITGARSRSKFIETSLANPETRAKVDALIERTRTSNVSEHTEQPRVITTETGERRVLPGFTDKTTRTTVSAGKRNGIARAYANYIHQNEAVDPTEMSYFGRRFIPVSETSSESAILPLERQLSVIPLDTRVPGQQNIGGDFGTQAQRQGLLNDVAEAAWRNANDGRPSAREYMQTLSDLRKGDSTNWWRRLESMSTEDIISMINEGGTSEANAIISRLRPAKKRSVLSALRKSNSAKAKRILSVVERPLDVRKLSRSMNLLDRVSKSENITSEIRKILNNSADAAILKEDPQSFFDAAIKNAKGPGPSKEFYTKRQNIIKMFNDAGISVDTKRFKEGGILKAQAGIKTPLDFSNNLRSFVNNVNGTVTNPYENAVFNQGVWRPITSAETTSIPDWRSVSPSINTRAEYIRDLHNGAMSNIKSFQSPATVTNKEGLEVGDNSDFYDIGKHVNHLYSLGRLATSAITAGLTNRRLNRAIDSLGVSKETPMYEDSPRWSSATEDRQLAAINEQNARPLAYTTGDPTLDRAMVLSNQSTALQNKLGVLANLSKKWDEYNYNLTATGNRNRQYALNADNAYRDALQQLKNTKAMQKAQADVNEIGTIGQSLSNYLYQNQTNAYNNRQRALGLLGNIASRPAEAKHNIARQSALENAYGAEYNTASDKNQYSSLESWAVAHHPDDFSNPNSPISKLLRSIDDTYLTDIRGIQQNTILADSADIWGDYTSRLLGNPSLKRFGFLYKKGGRVNGKTRYTLEPDERIWIEQNKAAFKASSKLNDNIIKLFLKLK